MFSLIPSDANDPQGLMRRSAPNKQTKTVAMVTKIADKIGLKLRNCLFGPNLRLLETDFLKN